MTQVDWIHFRKSVRKYKKKSLEPSFLEELKQEFSQVEDIIENTDYEIQLIEDGKVVKKALAGLASKYILVKAPHYILLTCKKRSADIFNLGYVGEQIVKFLTLNNLGTCWIGAKLSPEKLNEMVHLNLEHDFSILIGFGEPIPPLEFINNRKRKGMNEVFYGYDDLSDTDKFIAEAVMTAPSAMNNQPWRFYLNKGDWDYYKTSPKGFFAGTLMDLVNIDTGIGLFHVIETAHSLGSCAKFQVLDFHDGDQNYMGTLKIED